MIQSFAISIRERQLNWALTGGIPLSALEQRQGKVTWVLKPEHRRLNLFREGWWDYFAHAEHEWARALNSSQCFAVNVFGPIVDEPARARAALQVLLPTRRFELQDSIQVLFEFTPEGAPTWLGERDQPTQVDVYFRINRKGRCLGHLLVEVKFSEVRFGCCRGWEAKPGQVSSNPDSSRCLDASAILASPHTTCWLAQVEGRRYWDLISRPGSSICKEAIQSSGACPFRHGLYQIMRNRVLADELVRQSDAEWAEFAVCRHAGNEVVVALEEPVHSLHNAIEAFRLLSSDTAIRDWDAEKVVAAISSTDEKLSAWEDWMRRRYFSAMALPG